MRQTKYDEWDKILTIFTRDNGKVQAIAKGARKPKGKLVAGAQIFSYSNFILYKGKNLYNVNQADLIESFFTLREDLYKLAYATYILELLDAGTVVEYPNFRLFDLTIKTLKTLSKINNDSNLNYKKLLIAFQLKYISFIGYRPHIKSCTICNGLLNDRIKFSIEHGGVICGKCSSRVNSGYYISKEVLKAINDLLFMPLDKLESLKIPIKNIVIIEKIVTEYVMRNIEKRQFKSLEFLKRLSE